MQRFIPIATCVPMLVIGLAACVEARAVSDQDVQQLAHEYPVLSSAPAPEPVPSPTAAPEMVPARLVRTLPERILERVTGEATYYARKFEGRRTASGIPFRNNQMVAAHRAYPFGTLLKVTNLRNNKSVNVRVVDRGPFGSIAKARKTIIDLSQRAARELNFMRAGRTPVKVEVLEWGKGLPRGKALLQQGAHRLIAALLPVW